MKDRHVIAKIITSQWQHVNDKYNSYQIRTLHALRSCRTAALGGHLYQCDKCKSKHMRYNSCRNRHCSICQNTQKQQWIDRQEERLIEVPYYHIVFTVPHELNELFRTYPRQFYKLLFHSSWNTLNSFGWNHKYLGAQIGATMVLHTWGSNMSFHPHIHCIVPGGGVTLQNKWKNAKGKGKFLFPVKAMSIVFRVKFMEELSKICCIMGLDNIDKLEKRLYIKDWVVYAKPPFGGVETVIKYLARYTHKIAITHHRIIKFEADKVTFSYTDYRHRNQKKTMTLSVREFIRRYTLHFLPKGFSRIRHYGILSSAWSRKIFPNKTLTSKVDWVLYWKNKGLDVTKCPKCKVGTLVFIELIAPVRGPPRYKNTVQNNL